MLHSFLAFYHLGCCDRSHSGSNWNGYSHAPLAAVDMNVRTTSAGLIVPQVGGPNSRPRHICIVSMPLCSFVCLFIPANIILWLSVYSHVLSLSFSAFSHQQWGSWIVANNLWRDKWRNNLGMVLRGYPLPFHLKENPFKSHFVRSCLFCE